MSSWLGLCADKVMIYEHAAYLVCGKWISERIVWGDPYYDAVIMHGYTAPLNHAIDTVMTPTL